MRDALEKAFDYRGDVTITLKNSALDQRIRFDPAYARGAYGFVGAAPTEGAIPRRSKVSYAGNRGSFFQRRDAAAGKGWEAWVKKYWGKERDMGEE